MKKMIFMAVAAVLLCSCDNCFDNVNSLDDFIVTTEKSVYKVGERVEFKLSADADFVVFYSGEEGTVYEYKEKDRLYPDKMLLSFSTATYPDNGTNPQSGRLMWSDDFPGVYKPEWIRLSTWHDITDRIVYPKVSPTAYILYDTNDMEITDLFKDTSKPIYFCWAFETKANSVRNRFRIDNWRIHGEANRDMDFYSFARTGFIMVEGQGFDVQSSTTYYPKVTDKYVVWDGVAASTVYKDGWAVSGPIYYQDNINTGKDAGITIKTIGDPVKRVHNHYYEKPGIYEVAFEAVNANFRTKLSAVAKTTITVEGEDTVTESPVPIVTSKDSIEFLRSTKVVSFNLRCTSGWTITSSDDDLNVTPAAGNADDIYVITVTQSEGASPKAALTVRSGADTKTIPVSVK